MKLKKIYELIVQEGIAADPRDKTLIQDNLKKLKKHYLSLSEDEKSFFDRERYKNPYEDTRILNGDPDLEVQTTLVGIDIDISELLLLDRLNMKGKEKINLAISHHPQGAAFASFYEVMDMQSDIFHQLGIPINIAERLVEDRKKEISRKIHASNPMRVTDAARLLGIAFLCVHTPADNHAAKFIREIIDQKKPKTLSETMDILSTIEEYRIANYHQMGPRLLFGKPENRTGKIFVDMTGGTEGPKDMVDNLLSAGVGTIIGMHVSEEHYKKFKDKSINLIIAGHIASDSLGMNLLLDKIEKKGKIKIQTCSGFKRIKR